jgi:hypothetical protein
MAATAMQKQRHEPNAIKKRTTKTSSYEQALRQQHHSYCSHPTTAPDAAFSVLYTTTD